MTKNIKHLYRSRNDRVFLGVCSGLAVYFELDPVLVRAVTLIAAVLTGGAAIIAYLLVAIVIPVEPIG